MDDELHQELVAHTAKLRKRLSTYRTEDLVTRFAVYAVGQTNDPEHEDVLMSPSRQTSFALSVLLTTASPEAPTKLDDDEWRACLEGLNEIFGCYTRMYFREGGQATVGD